MTPISLFTAMIETSTVLSVIAARELVQVDQAVRLHRQVGDLEALELQVAAAVEHALVLGDAGDDVVLLVLVEAGDALDRQVVRFGGAGGEDDLLLVGADDVRDLGARRSRPPPRPSQPYVVVARVRVAEPLGEIRQHRLDHARIARRRRLVVEIDRRPLVLGFRSLGCSPVMSFIVSPSRQP